MTLDPATFGSPEPFAWDAIDAGDHLVGRVVAAVVTAAMA
jgi:hypothetical protein